MMKPSIHINGTSARELLAVNRHALRAVYAAIDALGEAAPNARDFYVAGEAAIRTAQEEHAARIQKLQSVLKDLEAICEHITDQEPG